MAAARARADLRALAQICAEIRDGGAWLEGDAARAVACDAMIVPVVTGDIDPGAVEDLIALCVHYQSTRAQAATSTAPSPEALAMLEHQTLGTIIQVVSGPDGVASFLRRNLLGKGLNGPSLPLDVGRPTTSRSTCAAWWPCATRPASFPADTSSKHTLSRGLDAV